MYTIPAGHPHFLTQAVDSLFWELVEKVNSYFPWKLSRFLYPHISHSVVITMLSTLTMRKARGRQAPKRKAARDLEEAWPQEKVT